jgi:hypothetical protein
MFNSKMFEINPCKLHQFVPHTMNYVTLKETAHLFKFSYNIEDTSLKNSFKSFET